VITQDPSVNREIALAQKRALLSVAVNGFLTLLKGFFALMAGSTALLGDAIHSATDVLASGATLVGLTLARRKHPAFHYGLYKAETIATLVSSVAVILAGYEIGRQALFGQPRHPDVALALPAALISFVIALLFGMAQVRAGKRLGSPALVADGRDYLADCMSTGVVIASLVGDHFGLHVDRWAAAVVSLFVLRAGAGLLFNALKELMDVAVDKETEAKIRQLVLKHPSVVDIERFMSRMAGGRVIVDLDVVMRTRSHDKADKIADWLEEEIVRRFPRVVMARVRPHYRQSGQIVRIIPVEGPVEGPGKGPAPHFAKAPWFLVERRDAAQGRILQREYVENPYKDVERRRGVLVGRWLLSFKPDEVVIPERKGGSAEIMLEEAGVTILSGQEAGADPSGSLAQRGKKEG